MTTSRDKQNKILDLLTELITEALIINNTENPDKIEKLELKLKRKYAHRINKI